MSTLARAALLAAWLLASAAPAGAAAAGTQAAPASSSRFKLREARVYESKYGDGRFRIRARFAPVERTGDLREGGTFSMLGRFAKAGVSCDLNAIFRDGFEPE